MLVAVIAVMCVGGIFAGVGVGGVVVVVVDPETGSR